MPALDLDLDPHRFALVRCAPGDPLPAWAASSPFYSITRTPDELSILCHEALVPASLVAERGWRCLKVRGPLPFTAIGVLDALTHPLARAGISIFALSTYDTDYLLVADAALYTTIAVLEAAGHTIHGRDDAR